MHIVYARETPPDAYNHSIFLAGPTLRARTRGLKSIVQVEPDPISWRVEALELLEEAGYEGVVFVPEPRDGAWAENYDEQAGWELQWLDRCDSIVVWLPRDLDTLPGFTTNVEFGRYIDSGRVVYGRPTDAPKTRYLDFLANRDKLNPVTIYDTLPEVLAAAIAGAGSIPVRMGGERFVPAMVWNNPSFQAWIRNVQAVGNRLDDFRSMWTFRIKGNVFSWVGQVSVWIEKEGRHKSNEWVFSRTDIACTVLYCPPVNEAYRSNEYFHNTKVVLVREFRSPGRTNDGFVWELPGGSVDPNEESKRVLAAAREAHEETGLIIPPERLRHLSSRQAAGTLSSHMVHAYACEITREEMAQAISLAEAGEAKGEVHDTEQCFTEVLTVLEVLRSGNIDWTTLGVITQALLG